MNELYDYMTEAEREEAVLEAQNDIRLQKLFNMYDMVEMNRQLNMMEAELKVLTEGGTEDDLAFLYEANEQEAGQKKKGILSTIFSAIGSVFKSIGNALSGLFDKNKINPEETTEIDQNTLDQAKQSDGVFAKIQEFIKTAQSKKWVRIVEVAGACIAAIAGFIKIYNTKKPEKKIQIKKGQLSKILNSIKDKFTKAGEDTANIEGDAPADKQNIIKKCCSKIKEVLSNGFRGIIDRIKAALFGKMIQAAVDAATSGPSKEEMKGKYQTLVNKKNKLKLQANKLPKGSTERTDIETQVDAINNEIQKLEKGIHEFVDDFNIEYGTNLTFEEFIDPDFDLDTYMMEAGFVSDDTSIFGSEADNYYEDEDVDEELEQLRQFLAEF